MAHLFITAKVIFWVIVILFVLVICRFAKCNAQCYTMFLFASPIFYFVFKIFNYGLDQSLSGFIRYLIGLFLAVVAFIAYLIYRCKK